MFYNQELTPILQFSTNLATPPTKALGPYRIDLFEELLVGSDVAELGRVIGVSFQRAIGRTSANQMDAFCWDEL
jgi:hypothetical protein